ncbi:FxsA family protein [Micromonospora sp. NPDC007208]|uniref:FxsA family protein n=1 Tax=Micromonospora trifolii TaxID=2911208 RepID=A0ABS9N941_9ACTN|nr:MULTISPECIES: FxsA family protein [Micromonospora]MCG5446477.1 FxsA family protein [Micromonospora trifolii]MCG5451212.1 FxsA family protein [Micromonospora hortensis]WTI05316.1 FxsA family protein [Micromonospora sp. NBC_00821]
MRRGLRFVPLALLLAVVLELAVFVGVGRALGFGAAVLLVFAASLLGLVLLRREGMRAWRGFRAAAAAGQPPGGQVTDGLVGLAGALLLAVPGLVSGLVGLLLLVPPVRRLARAGVRRATERRVSSMVAGDLFGPRTVRVRQGAPQPTPQPTPQPEQPVVVDGGRAIEGEIVEPGRH